ncbi:MAG: hypothetical protein HZB30_10035 [Nitrospirae bacterium]|nr:hypothetical protein [Nitrospirota bacterium]
MIKSESEKVLFKDMVRSCTFKKVKDALLELYPDQKKVINGYKYVFQTLRLMRYRYNKEGLVIDIRKVGRGKNAYFCVSGLCTEKGIQQSYALEYTPWSKWLGYEVDKKVLKKMPKEEIIAHCFWEMTFMGFTQDKIRSRLFVLRRRVKDIEDGKARTIPYKEVMARIKDKLKNG